MPGILRRLAHASRARSNFVRRPGSTASRHIEPTPDPQPPASPDNAEALAGLIRRSGLSIGVFFIYMLAEQIVVGISRNKYHLKWENYLPQEVTDMLLPVPYARAVFQRNASEWEQHIPVYLVVAALYLIIYCVFTSRRFVKTDL